jgi:hypothetical protein
MITNILTFLFVLISVGQLQAQQELRHWILGDSTRIEFTGVGPVIAGPTPMYGFEGFSTISDSEGNLICYSNGQDLWNAIDMPLLNSDSLLSFYSPLGTSVTQGSLLVPKPNDSTERHYYFFQIDQSLGQLQYSLIDRNLDGGLGGIVDSVKAVLLPSVELSECLHGVRHANGEDWWILTKDNTGAEDRLVKHLLTSEGISTVAGGELAVSIPHVYGEMITSPDGKYLAISSWDVGDGGWFALFEFDNASGDVDFIDSVYSGRKWYGYYGLAFSPNSKLAYTAYSGSVGRDTRVCQVSWDSCLIRMETVSNTSWEDSLHVGCLELAPDGKIYFVNRPTNDGRFTDAINYLGVINYPDSIGMGCQVNEKGFPLPSANEISWGLPNFPNFVRGAPSIACDSVTVDTLTSLELPIITQELLVHPSLSSGMFYLSHQGLQYFVFDLYGRSHEVGANSNTLDLTHMNSGMYILIGQDAHKIYKQRIIISK